MIPKLISHQKLPSDRNEREILRNKGQFWTPRWVADAMVAYVSQNTKMVYDPATGRGAFFEALLKLNKPTISFFGTDIDDDVLTDPIYKNKQCIVEKRDFISNPPAGKFSSIVANPPYIRHHRIDGVTKSYLKKLSLKITGERIDGRAGYHIYFFIQALNLLEDNGKLAFIMPADTCEGKFSNNLWKWISGKFCIEAVITFAEDATPFPNVDTNAIVFLIKNATPFRTFRWVKVNKPYSGDLYNFVSSNFKHQDIKFIDVFERKLEEAIATGFSRPEQNQNNFTFRLNLFAKVMRGIATGSNEFFFLTGSQVKEFDIPKKFLKRAIGRTKDVTESMVTIANVKQLESKNRPTYLLSIKGEDTLPKAITDYLKIGEKLGLPNRALIKQRKPWYKMEQRKVPPLLFAYLGRRDTRFIKNDAGVLPLTGFLCVYPLYNDEAFIHRLWQALNHPDTLANLRLVGKSYGSGAIKVEPVNLSRLPIPEHVVRNFRLNQM